MKLCKNINKLFKGVDSGLPEYGAIGICVSLAPAAFLKFTL